MKKNALLLLGVLLVSLTLAEGVVRLMGSEDADGNVFLGPTPLLPYRVPIESTGMQVDAYLQGSSGARLMVDPLLGWKPRPEAVSRDGLYRYDSRGIRVGEPADTLGRGRADAFRVVLLGDSFMHGDEVPYASTIGAFLERSLTPDGRPIRVTNLAVSGYGMDQALLRFENWSSSDTADLVILGVPFENLTRNVNLLRPLYFPGTGLPFAKPRFIPEGDSLRLIGTPVPGPEQVADLMADPSTWEWARFEYFLGEPYYGNHWWARSRFLSAVVTLVSYRSLRQERYAASSDMSRVSQAIFDRLDRVVSASGARFAIVDLPKRHDLKEKRWTGSLGHEELMTRVALRHTLVRTDSAMQAGNGDIDDLFESVHYSSTGNERVAKALLADEALWTEAPN